MTARQQIAIRLNPAALDHVRELAGRETDGNVSLMIRKLLAEALEARRGTNPREAGR